MPPAQNARPRDQLRERWRYEQASRSLTRPPVEGARRSSTAHHQVHDVSFIEGKMGGAAHLISLVSFSREQHHITPVSKLDGPHHRLLAILDSFVGPGYALLDIIENPLRILGARVVARQDRNIGQSVRDRSHLRSLTTITVAACSEDN